MSGDNMHNSADLIPEILNSGVRLLIYAGEDDFMCALVFCLLKKSDDDDDDAHIGEERFTGNYLGNERWMMALETEFSDEFRHKAHKYYSRYSLQGNATVVQEDSPGHVGMVRSAGPGAGNLTYVSLRESGHMVRALSSYPVPVRLTCPLTD
jgi:cathepsin A (carboxypeptidase C)